MMKKFDHIVDHFDVDHLECNGWMDRWCSQNYDRVVVYHSCIHAYSVLQG